LGDLRGTLEGAVAVWRGVPYAQQPVGQRRFAAPEPLLPWTGVRDAVEHAPLPLQSRSMVAGDRNDPKIRDEACLSMTVWSPDVSGALPVMVWIPGGAFLNGAGQLQLYNGSPLAANGNVVVVNVTYRVSNSGTSVRASKIICACATRSPRWPGCVTTLPPSAATRTGSPCSGNLQAPLRYWRCLPVRPPTGYSLGRLRRAQRCH
jgi:hypothetical protein